MPPPVAGAPAGVLVVALGATDAPVVAEVAVLDGDAEPAGAGGHGVVAVAVLLGVPVKETGVHVSHFGWAPV